MIAKQGVDVDGVPYFDDLYLDLVVYPDGTIIVDDMDELEEALSKKDITQEQFDLAIYTNKFTAQLMSKEQCEIWELFACIRGCFMPARGFKMAVWRELWNS